MTKLATRIDSVQHHRNGISGLGFHVVTFRYRQGRKLLRMAGVVFGFDEETLPKPTLRRYDGALAVAVLDLDHPGEKWRGDTFAEELFRAIERWESDRAQASILAAGVQSA